MCASISARPLNVGGLATAFLWLAAGCITKPNIGGVNKVKSVAIIGYSVVQPQSRPLTGLDHSFKSAAKFYRLTERQLAEARGWQVTPLEKVQTHAAYRSLSSKYDAHLLSGYIRPSDMLSQDEQVNLNPKQREKVRKALGVDGLVSIGFVLTRPTGGFSRTQTPDLVAKVSFDLYAGKGSKSIWRVSSLPGKPGTPPQLPDDLELASGDETTIATAIAQAVTTMMELRRQEEAAAKK